MSLRLLLWLFSVSQVFLNSTGYYQQPEVVQFTETPHDAVVCEGCRFELSCSILRQSSSAGEQYVPLPELEWIFNGTTINDLLNNTQVQVRDTATHRSAELSIFTARAHHNGVYQCRAKDGSNSTVCGESSSAISCVPTITISKPANIQIVGDSQYVETVSSCSDVVVLPCGRRLLGGVSVERPTLTWKRNGEELSLNSMNSESDLMMLSNGDLMINTRHDTDGEQLYECVGTFMRSSFGEHEEDGLHNVTLARYNVSSPYTLLEPETVVSLTSSADSAVLEGWRVELVCEASLRGGGGVCLSYNVTWTESPVVLSEGTPQSDGAPPTDDTLTSLLMNDHLLIVTGLSNTTQYCCQVLTDDAILEECTIVHVVQQREPVIDSTTLFLGRSREEINTTQINCSQPSTAAGPWQGFTWYHNGQLLQNHTSSTLGLTSSGELSSQVYGVYQCFVRWGAQAVQESSITRVLPFGLTNPPGQPSIQREVPYPDPDPTDPYDLAAYLLDWTPPLFTGGLSTLYYNVTIQTWFFPNSGTVVTSNTHSGVLVYLLYDTYVTIFVSVVNPMDGYSTSLPASLEQLSEHGPRLYPAVSSDCFGKVLYPPTLSINCGHGLVSLTWEPSPWNNEIINQNGGRASVYYIGNCTQTNNSTYQFVNGENFNSPHIFDEAVFGVGSLCQFSMASVVDATCRTRSDCFCYDPRHAQYSDASQCYVQGFVEFVASELQVFENGSSVEVCLSVRGFGFAVNMTTVEQTAIAEYNYAPLVNHRLHFSNYSGSLQQIHCFNITIFDNNVLEERREKSFNVTLSTDNGFVSIGTDLAIVEITDDDNPVLIFDQSSYTTSEGEGHLEVCVVLDIELEVEVPVTITSHDNTTNAGADYLPVNETILFHPGGEKVVCLNISINDDDIVEGFESFTLSLNVENSNLPAVEVAVCVLDNDYVAFNFDPPSYTIVESEGLLPICVSLEKELASDTVPVVISSNSTTARAESDYSFVNVALLFTPGGSLFQCFNVSIVDDNILEPVEDFVVSLEVVDEDIDPIHMNVKIIDDDYVTIYFNQSSYTVGRNDELLSVCAVIAGEFDVIIDVDVSSGDGMSEEASSSKSKHRQIVHGTLTFTPSGNPVQCFDVFINDMNSKDHEFLLFLTAQDDYSSQVAINGSPAIVTLESNPPSQESSRALLVGVSLGVGSFVIILVFLLIAGSVTYGVTILYRRHREFTWKIDQVETKEDEFDDDFEPPILIGADTPSVRRNSKDDFDSKTILNYLLPTSSSSTELNKPKVVPTLFDTDNARSSTSDPTGHDLEEVVKGEFGKVPPSNTTGYNVSLESGVVMDPDPHRKISDGSNSLSQGSHSYIGTSRTMTCSCSECQIHRERNHSGQVHIT